jgi:hypothetical protein
MRALFFAPVFATGLLLIAGCSNATQQAMPTVSTFAHASFVDANASDSSEGLLYVADTYLNEVVIYKQKGRNQQPIGKLTEDLTFPNGLWVDTHGNLWVANTNTEYGSTIVRFRRGATKPNLVLSDPDWQAYSVWVADDGAVYVVNAPYSGYFEIVEYPPHQQSPQPIGDSNLSLISAVVGDVKGDLFAAGLSVSGPGEIDELRKGSKQWTNTGITLYEPGDLGFDAAGNFVISDIGSDVIETFAPGQTKPSNTIECTAQCTSFAFNHRGHHLWVDEFNDENGTVDEFTYPAGKLIQSLGQPNGSSPDSVAAGPDLYP